MVSINFVWKNSIVFQPCVWKKHILFREECLEMSGKLKLTNHLVHSTLSGYLYFNLRKKSPSGYTFRYEQSLGGCHFYHLKSPTKNR